MAKESRLPHVDLLVEKLRKIIKSFAKKLAKTEKRLDGSLAYIIQLEEENKRLESLVTIDGLTGVSNRRFFDQESKREFRESLRRNEPLSIVMIDIDYFKKYNDLYGHQKGDEALENVAMALKAPLHRPADSLSRYGGEEFVFILANTDEAGAQVMAERARLAIEKLEIPHSNSDASEILTLSLGVATLRDKEQSLPALMSEADENLYKAKKCGRNRVCCD